MKWLDKLTEKSTRSMAKRTSRRHLLSALGATLVGVGAAPLLPVARASENTGQAAFPGEKGDPNSCDYWRYCAIDGFLCGCCGGSANSCPPGTEMSPITWIGTCKNPVDNKNYIISYNDCCGKSSCGNCLCTRNENDRPMYRPAQSNDINWCLGTKSAIYNCSTAIVIGLEVDKKG
jgi:methylamine dehydrogenase light chain